MPKKKLGLENVNLKRYLRVFFGSTAHFQYDYDVETKTFKPTAYIAHVKHKNPSVNFFSQKVWHDDGAEILKKTTCYYDVEFSVNCIGDESIYTEVGRTMVQCKFVDLYNHIQETIVPNLIADAKDPSHFTGLVDLIIKPSRNYYEIF